MNARTVALGMSAQIDRHKQKMAESPAEIELIIRLKIRANREPVARQIVDGMMTRHPHVQEYHYLDGVVDRDQLDDARAYIQNMQSDTSVWRAALETPAAEPVRYWTRSDMARYHDVSPATISRWLSHKPITGEVKHGAQYRIPAHIARNYSPPARKKAGRKPKK